ncbi:DeoR/GlpR family DNA-binding transcription regulator [Gorillibacterium sp. CAU 1737]|uniref:DeoR/GlpR family DNA-binding transcription regulator n=1 Tax=Gorillibacterium sp. CAU 1737 TaxID=3140362 RepID=UPI00325FE378
MLFEEERKQATAEYVMQQGRASVPELAQHFQVSESTIRRDLRDLEAQKLLRRTHGGAVALKQLEAVEPTFVEKGDRYQDQKKAIAQAALAMVEPGDSLFLDSGTSTYELAKLLKGFSGTLRVATNSVMAAYELSNEAHIELVLTGGMLRPETMAMVGPFAEKTIGALRFDKLFLGTNGFDADNGLTTPNVIEAATKERMIASARQVILLADHSKYGHVSFARFGSLEDVTTVITDGSLSGAALAELEAVGIEARRVESGGDEHETNGSRIDGYAESGDR